MRYVKIFIPSFAITVLTCTHLFSQNAVKNYTTIRTDKAPKIDGIINDEVWLKTAIASDLVQNIPDEGKTPTQKTEVRIAYDDQAIYVAAMLYDTSPDSICHQLGMRDDDINSDLFRIGFDTYNKQQDAYFFELYSSGVQRHNRGSDPDYDAVWESAVKITDVGWSLEMKIPYSAIRFPSVSEQTWGLQFTRTITRRNEFDQWSLVPKDAINSILYWGKLTGIKDIKSPLRLSVSPFASVYYEHAPEEGSVQTKYSDSYSYNFGADLKYGINEKFTLDMTLLPDFSQVQSDNKVKNLSYQEVVYNENRSFFKEGTELFNKGNVFYSRRIGKTPTLFYNIPYMLNEGDRILENPSKTRLLNAIKLSGRNNNGLGIGLFNAITDNTYAVIEDEQGNKRKILTEPLTNYNVLVFDQQLKNNSSVYFINTNVIRDKKWDDANVSSVGTMLCNKKISQSVDASFDFTQKFSALDSANNIYSDQLGYSSFIGTRKISGNFQWGISNTIINKTYDTRDMGYYVPNNKIKDRVYISYNVYKPTKFFRQTYNDLIYDYHMNPVSGKPIYSGPSIDNYTEFLNYWTLSAGASIVPIEIYDYYEPRVDGRYCIFPGGFYTYAALNSDSRKAIAYGTQLTVSRWLKQWKAESYSNTSAIRYRVNDKLSMKYTFAYSFDPYNYGFANFSETGDIIMGLRKLSTITNTITTSYIFKNDMNLSLNIRHYWNTAKYLQYFTLQENGIGLPNDEYHTNNNFSYNIFNIDLMYTWQFAPGSTISIVYKNAIENQDSKLIYNYYSDFKNTMAMPQSNSISLKVLYYLDYQNLKRLKNK